MRAGRARPHTVHTARRPLLSGPERPVRSPQAMLPTANREQAKPRRSAKRPSSLTGSSSASRLVLPQPLRLVLGWTLRDQLGGVERAISVPVGSLDDNLAAVGEGIRHQTVVDHGDPLLAVGHLELKLRRPLVVDDRSGGDDTV